MTRSVQSVTRSVQSVTRYVQSVTKSVQLVTDLMKCEFVSALFQKVSNSFQ